MMKNNLGKSLFIVCGLFLPFILSAKVILQAPDTFYKNDIVSFKIIASGTEISIPEIKNIDGNIVEDAGTSKHTTIINGSRSYQFIKAYALKGTKDIHIPSFEVLIDNKIEKTKATTIKMLNVEKTKSDLYDLTVSVDNKNVYVGEAIEFTLKFKYDKDLEIVNLDYKKPSFENFWIKELKPQQSQNNYTKYVEQEIKYLIFPQKAGQIKLEPLRIGVTTIQKNYGGGFFLTSPTITTPIYSNKLEINVKPLPQNINLIGDFTITSTIDKTVIDQGDAISYKLQITGRGNLDDLDEVTLNIPNTTIYDNPSEKEYNIKDKIYGGKYTKTYSIIGKDNFIIPSIEIQYFDKKTSTIKTVKTKKYDIVVNKKIARKVKLEVSDAPIVVVEKQKNEIIPTTDDEKIIYFILGLLSGMIILGIYHLFVYRKNLPKETALLEYIKSAKTPKELFKILVVYINLDEELDRIIYKLENLSLEEYKKEKKNILKVVKSLFQKDIKLNI